MVCTPYLELPKCSVSRKAHAAAPRAFTPTQLAQIYNYPSSQSTTANIVVVSFGGGLFGNLNPNTHVLTNGDCQTLWRQLGITNLPVVKVVGIGGMTNDPQPNDGASIENTLDVSIIGAMCPNSVITLIIAPNTEDGFPMVFTAALNMHPNIISVSWGQPENTVSPQQLQQMNSLFQLIQESGCNIFVASGDAGGNDGESKAMADFPCSSPWVTAVGGTKLTSPSNTWTSQTQEVVWDDNSRSSATGGGFSATFSKPTYQNAALPSGNMRGVPDIALNSAPGTGWIIIFDQSSIVVGGTSCAAPAAAALCGLMSTRTFINPPLYAANQATCFHDVISGTNGPQRAGRGWDACTGLGSPIGVPLKQSIGGGGGGGGGGSGNVTYGISPSSLVLTNTNPRTLTITVSPSGSPIPPVTWTSSNNAVATVNSHGQITAVANGTCQIGMNLTSQVCNVTVRGVSILTTNLSLLTVVPIGQSVSLAVVFTPSNATNQQLSYTSSNPSIATVTSGIVTGVSGGTATITITSTDANHVSTSCNVIVV
jgi:kumamolisin